MKYSSKSQAENGIDNTTIMTPLRVKQSILVNSSTAPTQLQADWNETDSTKLSYIKNKPTIPSNTSDLNNDSGFITQETDPVFSNSAAGLITASDLNNWNDKQDALVSGTNIKTINNQSLLGSGNINISGGVSDVKVNNTSIVSSGVANLVTKTVYNASTNKIVTESDLPKVPTKTSDLTNDSGFLTTETDPVFSASAASGITSSNISYWTGKQDALVSGINIKTINSQSILGSGDIEISSGGGGTGGTTDYDELVNHPKINGVELVGDKSTNELGINIPTKISDLENDGYLVTVKTGERRWATYAQG